MKEIKTKYDALTALDQRRSSPDGSIIAPCELQTHTVKIGNNGSTAELVIPHCKNLGDPNKFCRAELIPDGQARRVLCPMQNGQIELIEGELTTIHADKAIKEQSK